MDCKIISLLMKTIGENNDKNVDEIEVGSSGLTFMVFCYVLLKYSTPKNSLTTYKLVFYAFTFLKYENL